MAVYNSTTHEIASNSLTDGLIFAVYLEDSNTDPVLGTEAKDNSTGAGADGWTQSGSEVLSFDLPSGLNPTNGTVIDMFFGAAVSSPASYGKFSITTDSEFQLSRNNADIGLRIQINNSLMQFPSGDIPTNFWDDAENQIAWRWSNGDTGQVSANTTHSPTQTITAWPTTAFSNATFSFGNRSVADGADRQIDGRLKYRFVWDRALSNAEIDAIYADPYQLIQPVSAGNTTDIYINFESGGAAPTVPWTYNQPAFTSGTGVLVADLVDSENQATGYGLEIVTAFFANGNGAWGGTDSGDWQAATFNDAWYTANGGSSSFKFTGLPAGADYTLELAGHNGNSRDTDFTVEGTTLEYNVSDTATTTPPVSFSGTVDPDGEIVVSLERSAADGQFYGYVNGAKLSITEAGGVSPSITDINGNNTVRAGQTVTVNGTSFGTNGNVTAATLGGESLTVNSNTDTTASVTIPAGIVLEWGSTTNQLVLVVGGSNYSLNGVTLSAEAGWDYIDFASAPALSGNPAEPSSIYEALTNYAPLSNYTMLAGDQLAFEDHERLTMNADTTFSMGTIDPPETVSIQAKVWKDATSEWTPEFTIQIDDLGAPVVGDPDITAPIISITGLSIVVLTVGDTYTEQGATWTDDTDGSGNATVGGDTVDPNTAGTYLVTYDHTDNAGNAALQAVRTVVVVEAGAESGVTPLAVVKPAIKPLLKSAVGRIIH